MGKFDVHRIILSINCRTAAQRAGYQAAIANRIGPHGLIMELPLPRAFFPRLRYSSLTKSLPVEPAMSQLPEHHEDHPEVITRNARAGLLLFAIYFAIFVIFLLLNVFTPETMTMTAIPLGDHELSLGGPNLAVVFGIALIFIAIILSLVYMRLTRTRSS
jgi:uncharacterized membrane protein (DUF485 family)